MAKTISTYSIDLEARLAMSDAAKKGLQDVQNSLSELQKSADDLDFEKAGKSFDEIRKNLGKIGENAKAYGGELNKTFAALQKQAEKLTYSQTEQGKKERERLQTLKAQAEISKADRKEIERLERRVVDLNDEELEAKLKQNRALRIQIKTAQAELRVRKSAASLIRDDLKGITERIRKQKEFLKTLSATGKAYYAIKKAGGVAAKGAAVAAGIGGAFVGLAGAGMAHAETEAASVREAARIKAAFNDDVKRGLLSSLRMKTGADAASIVDAVNRVVDVLGRGASRKDIEAAAVAELRMPGASELFRAQSEGAKADYNILLGRLEAVQKSTGLSVAEMQGVAQSVSRMGNYAFRKGATQSDLVALLGGLQGAGVFTDAQQQERAVRAFMGTLKAGENIFDKAQSFNWTRYAGHNQQARNRVASGIAAIDWAGLRSAATSSAGAGALSTAEQAAIRVRQMEENRNRLIMRILEHSFPIIDRVMKWLDENMDRISLRLAQGMAAVLKVADFVTLGKIPVIAETLEDTETRITELSKLVDEGDRRRERVEAEREKVLEYIQKKQDETKLDAETAKFYRDSAKQTESLEELVRILGDVKALEGEDNATALPQKSMGGLLVGRGIVGERGGELVIPMEYSRQGRAANIVQNISQTFNMAGNQTTARSFATVMGDRSFNKNAFARMRSGEVLR
jgi:hypothetical protein